MCVRPQTRGEDGHEGRRPQTRTVHVQEFFTSTPTQYARVFKAVALQLQHSCHTDRRSAIEVVQLQCSCILMPTRSNYLILPQTTGLNSPMHYPIHSPYRGNDPWERPSRRLRAT